MARDWKRNSIGVLGRLGFSCCTERCTAQFDFQGQSLAHVVPEYGIQERCGDTTHISARTGGLEYRTGDGVASTVRLIAWCPSGRRSYFFQIRSRGAYTLRATALSWFRKSPSRGYAPLPPQGRLAEAARAIVAGERGDRASRLRGLCEGRFRRGALPGDRSPSRIAQDQLASSVMWSRGGTDIRLGLMISFRSGRERRRPR
jgi:hypothetical protein